MLAITACMAVIALMLATFGASVLVAAPAILLWGVGYWGIPVG